MASQFNEKSLFSDETVVRRLREKQVRILIADVTRGFEHPQIKPMGEEMQRLKRTAVPVMALYSPNNREAPLICPEICTPKAMLELLDLL